jgi:hypothetical protein
MIEDFLYKLAELEKATDNSIGFQRWCDGWEVSSFNDNTPFCTKGSLKTKDFKSFHIKGETFEEVFNKAYDRISKKKSLNGNIEKIVVTDSKGEKLLEYGKVGKGRFKYGIKRYK